MTNTFLYVVTGVFGLIVGSFLNVVIARDNNRKTIAQGRSHCPHCKHTLAWYELIPVLSFLFLGAKCLKCKKSISWQYPLVELVMAGLALFALWYGYIERGSVGLAVGLGVALALLLVVSAIDIRTLEVPIEYVVAAGVIGALGQFVSGTPMLDILLGVLGGAGSLLAVVYGWKLIFKQEGMGSGDIWIAGALGAIAAYPLAFIVLFAAIFTGAIIGIALLPSSKKGLQTAIPFGPFLNVGLIIALVWGQRVLDWYIL